MLDEGMFEVDAILGRFTELRQKRELKKIRSAELAGLALCHSAIYREIFMDRYPASSKEVIDPVIDYVISTITGVVPHL